MDTGKIKTSVEKAMITYQGPDLREELMNIIRTHGESEYWRGYRQGRYNEATVRQAVGENSNVHRYS